MRTRFIRAMLVSLIASLIPILLAAQQPGAPPAQAAPIRLRAATFTPGLGEAPAIPPGLTIAGYAQSQRGYYLVQFRGPVMSAWKDAVSATGAEFLDYVPEFAFKVRMTPGQARQVEGLADVAWVGLFHPAYKLDPRVARNGVRPYAVRIERGADVTAAAAQIAATGAQILHREGNLLRVAADSTQLDALAAIADIAWIENFAFRKKHNEYGGGVIMKSALANANGYTGSTQTVAIADTGYSNGTTSGVPSITSSRVVGLVNWPGANNSCYDVTDDGTVDVDSGHGTHTSVSAVGANNEGFGRGVATGANLYFQAVENWATMKGICALTYPNGYYLIGLPSDLHTLFQPAYNAGARIHSNSWGSDEAGAYTTDSANSDDFVWDNPKMVVTFSAGNAGVDASPKDGVIDSGSIGSPATAKNVISVGASENDRQGHWECDTTLSYTNCSGQQGQNIISTYGSSWPADYPNNPIKDDPVAGNAEQMAAFSSRGPTDDGRIKPDVMAPGTWVLSGYSDLYQQGYDAAPNPKNGAWQYDGWGYPARLRYKYMGGTSMSNPLTAGGAAIVRDFYQKVYAHDASAALVKATLINSAVDMLDENNDGANDNDLPIPNVHEGWGRVDLLAATSTTRQYVDNTSGLGTSGTASYQYTASGGAPFKVTLVWSDYPSSTSATKNLVNDLDLVVTGPLASYRGNVFAGGWSQGGGTADRTNNVENVFVQSATAGTWTVQVSGFNVPNGPQPFALVVEGGTTGPPPPAPQPPSGLSATPVSSSQINLAWTDNADNESGFLVERCQGSGCTSFSQIAQVGANVTTYNNSGLTASTLYRYQVRAFNGGGNSASSNIAEATTNGAPPPSAMHVGDLDGSSAPNGKNRWRATATVTVHDGSEAGVANATVSGTWSGGISGSASCTTGSTGVCSMTSGRISTSNASATFTVTNVTHATLTYQSGSNHDPDGDSSPAGTAIVIARP